MVRQPNEDLGHFKLLESKVVWMYGPGTEQAVVLRLRGISESSKGRYVTILLPDTEVDTLLHDLKKSIQQMRKHS